MEKICIAKLRKSPAYPGRAAEAFGWENRAGQERPSPGPSFDARNEAGSAGKGAEVPGKSVSLLLTQEQMQALRANRRLASSLSAERPGGSAAIERRDEAIVLRFEFDPAPPVRLLKVEEVVQMLRISKSSLNKMVRQGLLKSYRFGRLRRILLADLLSYLEDHREYADDGPQAPESKPSAAVWDQPSLMKEE